MARPGVLLAVDLDQVAGPASGLCDPGPGVSEFSRLFADRTGVVLAYLTDTHLSRSLTHFRSARLPEPDFLACDQGTTLYRSASGTYTLDAGYREWVTRSMGAVSPATLRHIVADAFPQLSPQEFDSQGEFKLSYYIETWRDFQVLITALRQSFRHIDARVRLDFSIDRGDPRGRLRILPDQISKSSVLDRVGALTGIPAERTVYAAEGDPGDVAAIRGGYACIVVGDAPRSLRNVLNREASQHGTRIYFTRHRAASGVLEGYRALGFAAAGEMG